MTVYIASNRELAIPINIYKRSIHPPIARLAAYNIVHGQKLFYTKIAATAAMSAGIAVLLFRIPDNQKNQEIDLEYPGSTLPAASN